MSASPFAVRKLRPVRGLAAFLLHFCKNYCREGTQGKQHVAKNCCDVRSLIATTDSDRGSLRPCIEACPRQFNSCRKVDHVASASWMLATIRERVRPANARIVIVCAIISTPADAARCFTDFDIVSVLGRISAALSRLRDDHFSAGTAPRASRYLFVGLGPAD